MKKKIRKNSEESLKIPKNLKEYCHVTAIPMVWKIRLTSTELNSIQISTKQYPIHSNTYLNR